MSALAGWGGRERWAAWAWLGCAQFFVCEAVAALGWKGHYSYTQNFISDLGSLGCQAGCSRWHALMNASFLMQGLLIAAGTLLSPAKYFRGWVGGTARVLLLLAALGILVVAHTPEDVDMNLHIVGARVHFACGTLAMLCWSAARRRREHHTSESARGVRLALAPGPALLAAGVALFGDLLLVYGNAQSAAVLGMGTVERIAAYPFPLWLAWTGLMLVRSGRPSPVRS